MRINAYILRVTSPEAEMPVVQSGRLGPREGAARWELYRLLAEPVRPRLLALVAVEELAVGELAELLREGQPKVSRHAAALRDAGLVTARRQGTWTLLRLAAQAAADPVVADAVRAGKASCEADGTLERVDAVLAARDARAREFFARGGRPLRQGPPEELSAYLAAVGPLLPERRLAVDAGTGDGALLEVLAPVYERVVALDRSAAQLELAAARVRRRGFDNVELVLGELDGPEVRAAMARALGPRGGGADAVFAVRVLHHAPIPSKSMRALARLARPPRAGERGGAVCVLDYEAHDDQALREREADLWLGFSPVDLRRLAEGAGLASIAVRRLPAAWRGEGADRHLVWQLLVGFRGSEADAVPERNATRRRHGRGAHERKT